SWLARSDTIFKRLYWTDYHGKFASVRWQSPKLGLGTISPAWYNETELVGYKSASTLKNYLDQLKSRFPTYKFHILAHSAGAPIASEAMSLGAPFDTFILSSAPMPASCYDVNAPTDAELVAADTSPNITPLWQPMGYRGAHTNISGPGRVLSYFN